MNRTLIFISSFSIVIASVIGWVRFRKINPTYYPFVFLLWAGLLNEIISTFLTYSNTALNTNVYYFLEGVLSLAFLRNLRKDLPTRVYSIWFLLLVSVWTAEMFTIHPAREFVSYYIIIHSLLITLISVQQINHEIGTKQRHLFHDPDFLICACFIIYFTFAIVVEVIWKFNFFGTRFKANLQTILSFINIITNLIYALAIVWMPKKQKFSLSSFY